jgi:transposase
VPGIFAHVFKNKIPALLAPKSRGPPYRLIGERVDVRLTAQTVEIFHAGQLVANHARAKARAQRSTRRTHRPDKHIAVIDQSLERVLERALAVGPATFGVVQQQASARKHPEETLRSAMGILRLASDFTPARLEAACERALLLKACSYRAVRTLLQTPPAPPASPALDLFHENVRGAKYFQ